MSVDTSVAEQEHLKRKEHEVKVQRQVAKLPADQQAFIENTRRIVDQTILDVNAGIESGESFKLHAQMKQFFATHKLRDLDAERDLLHELTTNAIPSKTFFFQGKIFVKTPTNNLMLADDYIYILEAAVMKQESFENICTFLSLKDIFKLLGTKIKTMFVGDTNGEKQK
tara:strand:+ start:89554 stop:90060 length:507 start_codon:yes stop_codon:yes gene_type:complete